MREIPLLVLLHHEKVCVSRQTNIHTYTLRKYLHAAAIRRLLKGHVQLLEAVTSLVHVGHLVESRVHTHVKKWTQKKKNTGYDVHCLVHNYDSI